MTLFLAGLAGFLLLLVVLGLVADRHDERADARRRNRR